MTHFNLSSWAKNEADKNPAQPLPASVAVLLSLTAAYSASTLLRMQMNFRVCECEKWIPLSDFDVRH